MYVIFFNFKIRLKISRNKATKLKKIILFYFILFYEPTTNDNKAKKVKKIFLFFDINRYFSD